MECQLLSLSLKCQGIESYSDSNKSTSTESAIRIYTVVVSRFLGPWNRIQGQQTASGISGARPRSEIVESRTISEIGNQKKKNQVRGQEIAFEVCNRVRDLKS